MRPAAAFLILFLVLAQLTRLAGGTPEAPAVKDNTLVTGVPSARHDVAAIRIPVPEHFLVSGIPPVKSGFTNDPSRANDLMRQTGIRFQENRGQIADTDGKTRGDIAYMADAPGARLYFRSDGISYVFTKSVAGPEAKASPSDVSSRAQRGISNEAPESRTGWDETRNSAVELYRLDMTFEGSNPFTRIRGEDPLPGYSNYYLPHCPDGVTGVREYGKIVYENVYDRVDLEMFTDNGRIKYNFVVHPGGDPGKIRMRYDGATDVAVNADGALSLATPLGGIEEAAPYTYAGGRDDEVASQFLGKGNTISFAVDDYDRSRTLVIDPWATYYGGGNDDVGTGVETDVSGNVYLTGRTVSRYFPVPNGIQSAYKGSCDAFAGKFSASGTLLWMTYYGGSSNDRGMGCAVDAAGDLAFCGLTASANFPVQNAIQSTLGGNNDGFVVLLNASGIRQWATYYGGSAQDWVSAAHFDVAGNCILTGDTFSTNFPVSSSCYQSTSGGLGDGFLVKLSAGGSRVWATYLGGNQNDDGLALTTDGDGNVYVGMYSFSTNLPTTSGAFQQANAGSNDAYVAKFTSNCSLLWATYFGGSDSESSLGGGLGINVDSGGNIITAFDTESMDIPVTGAIQSSLNGLSDAFVVKFSATGTVLRATYFGGNGEERLYSSCVDGFGNILLTGSSNSIVYPFVNAHQPYSAGRKDLFVVKLSPVGSTIWSTLLGGNEDDIGRSIATNSTGDVLVVGSTSSTNFPIEGAHQPYFAGGMDAFVVSFSASGAGPALRYATITVSPNPTVADQDLHTIYLGIGPQSVQLSAGITTGYAVTGYLWSTGATGSSVTVTPVVSTTYSVIVTDVNGTVSSASVRIHVIDVRCGKNLSSVNYCDQGKTKCGSASQAMSAIKSRSAYLGSCLTKNVLRAAPEEEEYFIANYPNPFNPVTVFRYGIPEQGTVHVQIFSVEGRMIAELVSGWREAGTHHVQFDGAGLPSGVYLYRLEANDHVRTGTMTLVK